ncbi:MAG: DUF4493 domain-containing protein [Rikenellaceae bacterium]
MKKYFTLTMALLLLGSCNRDGDMDTSTQDGYGSVSFVSSVDNSIDVITRSESGVNLPGSVTLPTTADFSLKITGDYTDSESDSGVTSGSYNLSYGSIDDCNASSLTLLETVDGNTYTASVSSGTSTAEGENLPCFAGEVDFSVVARETNTIAVTTVLTNSLFQFSTSEWFDNYYTDAEFTITTSRGNSFSFGRGEDERLIFVEAGTTLTLEGSATKSNGYDVVFASNVIGVTSARELSSIIVDASQAGGVSISVQFNTEFTELDENEVDYELNVDAPDKE